VTALKTAASALTPWGPHDPPPSLSHLEASRAVPGIAAAARGQEHRDEAERMKEAEPEDSQASSGSRIFAIISTAF
jgi:hypothetical protein